MQNNLLKRLLDLSKKTGDRIVFADLEGDNAHVVLSLNDYERLVTGVFGSSPPKADAPRAQKPEVRSQKFEDLTPNTRPTIAHNPLKDIEREVVAALEVERAQIGAGIRDLEGADRDMEVEERYFLEPIE